MSVYRDMRDAVVTILETVELSSEPAFAQVATAPISNYTGTPAATVVPAEIGSEYLNVSENLRAYGFNVHLHMPLNREESWGEEIDTMLDLVDGVLDALDQSRDLNGAADFIEAVPMEWDVVQGSSDLELLATIHIVAKKSVTV